VKPAALWYDLTGMLRGSSGKLSQLRVTVAVFGSAYVAHWPAEWTADAVAALAILVFATPVDALFARVPVTDALGAVQAFFGSVGGRARREASGFGAWGGEPTYPASARATMPGDEQP